MSGAAALTSLEEVVLDPITGELMLNAVFTPLGRVYEEGVIQRIIRERGRDPFTNQPLTNSDLRPAIPIRQAAEEYQKIHDSRANRSSSGDAELDAVRTQFNETWTKTSELVVIDSVERAKNAPEVMTRFMRHSAQKEVLPLQFHGTKGSSVQGIEEGFRIPDTNKREDKSAESKLRFGRAIYTTESSSKASTYGDKVIIVCDVVPGRVKRMTSTFEELTPSKMQKDGFDSVLGELDQEPSERAFYHPDALLAKFIIKYHTVGIDRQELPSEIPRTDVPTLLKFLTSTERHQELAMRYLGDCFRDMTRATCHAVFDSDQVDMFFGALARGLQAPNENLNLHSLRILWNMSFNDRDAQRVILERIDVKYILAHVVSAREANQLRGAAVVANLCHLEALNHRKVLSQMPDFGKEVVSRAHTALKKTNRTLCLRLLTSANNLASSGVPMLQRHVVQSVVNGFMDCRYQEIREVATRLVSNVILDGRADPEWEAQGFRKTSAVEKE